MTKKMEVGVKVGAKVGKIEAERDEEDSLGSLFD